MLEKEDIEAIKVYGEDVDFGKAAKEYRKFRAGFPASFFTALNKQSPFSPNAKALDLGTGTGTVARGLAKAGLDVIGTDPAAALLEQAAEIARDEDLNLSFQQGNAEHIAFQNDTFDIVTAGQCWHWFDRSKAAQEIKRILKPNGLVVICHFDWLPLPGSVVAATEAMILEANPEWNLAGGIGIYPEWLVDLANAGFEDLQTQSYDVAQAYSHEAWRGRIQASAGIKASTLSKLEIEKFDQQLKAMLKQDYPKDPLGVPHRVWWLTGRCPTA